MVSRSNRDHESGGNALHEIPCKDDRDGEGFRLVASDDPERGTCAAKGPPQVWRHHRLAYAHGTKFVDCTRIFFLAHDDDPAIREDDFSLD